MVTNSPIPAPAPTPATGTPSVPALSRSDHGRINAWFVHEAYFLDIAEELKISTTELATWATQPHIVEALNLIRSAIKLRTESLYSESRYASLSRLTRIVRSNPNDEIARRAADRILRPSSNPDYQPPKPREHKPTGSSPWDATHPTSDDTPREHPSSDSTPTYIPGFDSAPPPASPRPAPLAAPRACQPASPLRSRSGPALSHPTAPATSTINTPPISINPSSFPQHTSPASLLAAKAGSLPPASNPKPHAREFALANSS